MSGPSLIQHGRRVDSKPYTISLGEYMLERIKLYGDDVAQVSDVEGQEMTVRYSEILRHGRAVSRVLREHGVGVGDTVMFCCGNTVENAPIFFGTLLIGAACAPVNPAFDTADLLHALQVNNPQLIICNPQSLENAREVVKMNGSTQTILGYEELARRYDDPENNEEFRAAPIPDPATHVAFVMASSGTTGMPKGVEITHAALLNVFDRHNFPRSTVALCTYSPIWITSMAMNVGFVCMGAKLVLMREMKTQCILECVQKYKVSYMAAGAQYLMALAKWPSIDKYDLSSLKSLAVGGTKLSQSQLEFAQTRLKVKVTPSYGMTEALRVTKPAWDRNDKPGSIGILHDNFEAKVVDIDTGALLGPNKQGEIYFKGPSLTKGYRGNPEATKALFDKDGYLITGDLGYYDEEGYFYIQDRIKDTIRYAQYWHLSSTDIEEVLCQHPGVWEGAVVGVPNDEDVERAAAYVVRVRGEPEVTAEDISTFVKERAPERMWLHGGVFFVDKLPRTVAGKVKKHELRAMFVESHPTSIHSH